MDNKHNGCLLYIHGPNPHICRNCTSYNRGDKRLGIDQEEHQVQVRDSRFTLVLDEVLKLSRRFEIVTPYKLFQVVGNVLFRKRYWKVQTCKRVGMGRSRTGWAVKLSETVNAFKT